MVVVRRHVVALVASVAAVVCPACSTEQAELEEPRPRVKALWDPGSSTLPTPTDLVRDPTTGRLALPVDEQLTPGELEWRTWLNTLDGYPASSSITIPVDGPIDPASLGGSLVLVEAGGAARVGVDLTFDEQSMSLKGQPVDERGVEALLDPGKTYRYGLWGYDGGARGAGGEPVIADAGFYLVRKEISLLDHVGALPGDSVEQKREAAESLEALRTSYAPIYEDLARFGLERALVATAGEFTVSGRPAIWFDPASGQVPVPNEFLRDDATGLIELPIRESDDEEARHIKELLSTYDGFSTTGAITIKATEAIDPVSATSSQVVRLFRVGKDNQLIEHADLERGVLKDEQTFWLRPSLAMEPETEYLYVVTRELRTKSGRELVSHPLGALLKFRAPVAVDGASQIDSLDDESAALVEPRRLRTDAALDLLEAQHGIPREDILLAGDFETLSTASFLMEWRGRPYKESIRTDVVNAQAKSPFDRGLLLAMPSVKTVVTGQLTTPDFLDPATLALRKDGAYEERLIDFVLTIPRSADPGEPIPTVIFGHGLMTSRELLYMITEKLAQNGYAAITIDLPLHGERAVCIRTTDCKGDNATCDEFGRCIDPDGSYGELRRIESPWADGPSYPITSGEPFIDLTEIEASRDHFIQSVVDMSQLIRVVRGADWSKVSGGYVLDGQDLVYLGMSLGGILGSILSVVEPTIQTFVLNVPGAGLLEMVENSAAFESIFAKALAKRELMKDDSDDYFRFQNAIRWSLDPVDPVNTVQFSIQQQLRYVDPVDGEEKMTPTKRVLLQMAEGDSVVPNITTEILSARMGVEYRRYTPSISNHGFLFDPTSGEGRRARNDMIEFFEQR